MSSDIKPFKARDPVLMGTLKMKGFIQHLDEAGRWVVRFEGGVYDRYWHHELTHMPKSLTIDSPAPVPEALEKRPALRPRWEIKRVSEDQVDAYLAEGWEPYAVTHEEYGDLFLDRWTGIAHHLRRRVEVSDVK